MLWTENYNIGIFRNVMLFQVQLLNYNKSKNTIYFRIKYTRGIAYKLGAKLVWCNEFFVQNL